MMKTKDLTPDAVAVLVKTSELLKAGNTIGSYARDKHGFPVSPVNDGAECYCTLGGLFKVASEMLLIEALPNTGLLGTELLKCTAAMEIIDLLAEQGTKALAEAGGVLDPQAYDPEPGTEKLSTVIRLNDRTDSMFLDTIHELAEEARPKVIDFLRLWLAWAEAGGQGAMFDDRYGLCWNFTNEEWEPHNLRIKRELQDILDEEFRSQSEYPFGGHDVYQLEKLEDCAHRNPQRLAWVKRKIQEAA